MFPRCNTYRLYERGEAGICCDIDGVALGPVKLVERADKAYFVRPAEDITLALEAAYGPLPEIIADDLVQKIVGIARSLNGGELTHAMLKTLYLRLPEIPSENFAKMNRAAMGIADPRRRADVMVADRVAAGITAGEMAAALGKSLLQSLPKSAKVVTEKYNHNHDERGRFSSGPGGASNVGSGDRADMASRGGNLPSGRGPNADQRPERVASNAPLYPQSVRSAPPPGSNKVGSVRVGTAQGFVTPAKRVEFTTMNDEIRVETTGGALRNARDGKSGFGTTLAVGEVTVWGDVYRAKPVTGNEKAIDHFSEPVRISVGKMEKKTIKLKQSGYIRAYIQPIDTTLPDRKVEIFE